MLKYNKKYLVKQKCAHFPNKIPKSPKKIKPAIIHNLSFIFRHSSILKIFINSIHIYYKVTIHKYLENKKNKFM